MVARPVAPSVSTVIDDAVRRLVERFHPIKIILFGSHARGEGTPDSDLDFLVVMPDATDRQAAAVQMHQQLRDLPMPKDLLVTTPSEIARRGEFPGTVLRPALREGKVLYEQR